MNYFYRIFEELISLNQFYMFNVMNFLAEFIVATEFLEMYEDKLLVGLDFDFLDSGTVNFSETCA